MSISMGYRRGLLDHIGVHDVTLGHVTEANGSAGIEFRSGRVEGHLGVYVTVYLDELSTRILRDRLLELFPLDEEPRHD